MPINHLRSKAYGQMHLSGTFSYEDLRGVVFLSLVSVIVPGAFFVMFFPIAIDGLKSYGNGKSKEWFGHGGYSIEISEVYKAYYRRL